MGAMVVKEAVKRAGIQPSDVDEVVIGQVGEVAENGFIARAVSLKAGMPKETTAYSVNRQCGSGLQSIAEAVMEIQTGQADVVVAGGTENISRLPYYVNDARWGARMGHKVFEDGVIDILTWPSGWKPQWCDSRKCSREIPCNKRRTGCVRSTQPSESMQGNQRR